MHAIRVVCVYIYIYAYFCFLELMGVRNQYYLCLLIFSYGLHHYMCQPFLLPLSDVNLLSLANIHIIIC